MKVSVNTFKINMIIGLYAIVVGLGLISAWILAFATTCVWTLQMNIPTLTSHVIAEILAGVLSIIGGLSLIKETTFKKHWLFLGLGAVLYAIINVIGYYYAINITWLVIILLISLLFHLLVTASALKLIN